mmetsp:Transcript_51834/g.147754  ORF Transcript_51834/g.147754 Transcript_51834/m.147754 type:complete len:89 (+) Transcript_51834:55-321(+)
MVLPVPLMVRPRIGREPRLGLDTWGGLEERSAAVPGGLSESSATEALFLEMHVAQSPGLWLGFCLSLGLPTVLHSSLLSLPLPLTARP